MANASAPSTSGAARTLLAPGSVGKATAMRVPSSDQLNALSVPRLRAQRSSGGGTALAAAIQRASAGTPRPTKQSRVSFGAPSLSGGASAKVAPPPPAFAPDIVLASPR